MSEIFVGWKATIAVEKSQIPVYEEILSPLDAAVDTGKEDGQWMLNAFFTDEQTKESILKAFKIADDVLCVVSEPKLTAIKDEDWQEKMKREFPPLQVADYFIHTFDEPVPEGLVELKIPAGMAFGTGEHPTTSGCLILYKNLTQERSFKNALDMGCGSAILAMAASKHHGLKSIAVDIDKPSVDVAIENCELNNVLDDVTCAYSNGFPSDIVRSKSPYDLIFANILANPLIEMSDDLTNSLTENGVAIISGFLTSQKEEVLKSYTNKGLKLVDVITTGDWVAAALSK
jgi:ribosomal protein L11 methyltransferase